MSRLPLVDADDPTADPKARRILGIVRESRGVNLNIYKEMANHPELLRTFLNFGTVAYFQNTPRPPQRELAYLTAAVANDCFY